MNHLESPPNLSLSLRKFWSCKQLRMKWIFKDILKISRWMYWKQLKIIWMLHWILKTPDENVCCLIFQIKLNLEHRHWGWFWHLWSLIPEHYSLLVDAEVTLVLFASRQIWPSCHAALDVVSCGYPVVREEHLSAVQWFNHFWCQLCTVAQTRYDWRTPLTDCMTVSIIGGPGPFKRNRPKILTIKEWGFLIRCAR